ncbi:hypothetical protein AS189_16510 [Arthrobacter alpinus]|uniref:GP-PDE domain-containing protein n=2 Tax=Arthrobacter alpinus TaxID=656366 RepID=A0A0S2M237_9MICC|nr:hypothetical protein AS189_16510 [Arthrobacter alpinus]
MTEGNLLVAELKMNQAVGTVCVDRKVGVSRRQFFAALSTSMVLAGCSSPSRQINGQGIPTVAGLIARDKFLIAHRGSGDNWTEHTMAAYSSSLTAGATAIEVSVHATSDGILVCHHDESTLRMTGVDLDIGKHTFSELSGVLNDARAWLGPAAAPKPIPRLEAVLDAFASRAVIFIEDKQGTNTELLLDLMDKYPRSRERFVWKQPAASLAYVGAKARGYTTWGYFMDDSDGAIEKYSRRFDLVGIFNGASDDDIRKLVRVGIKTICWEIHTRSMAARVESLGVDGLMCSNYPYVSTNLALSGRDSFATGRRAAGDLPSALSWKFQPVIDPNEGSLAFNLPGPMGYSMGSLCPLPSEKALIRFEVRWPGTLPSQGTAGIAFGLADDSPFIPGISGRAGYILKIRPQGSMELATRKEGVSHGTVIGTHQITPMAPGEWRQFSIGFNGVAVGCSSGDFELSKFTVDDVSNRGKYFSLVTSNEAGTSVEFRNIIVQ